VARSQAPVHIYGESGTGKELVAEAIHQLGARTAGPFVALNTAAIPRELIESELFGHEKGAFTGAVARNIGKFEQAHGGTLFLDEIGDMPPEAQTRLLRALQSGRIRRVGGRDEIAVDVRIIAATNRDLAPMIAAGSFREDLFYRLNVVPIQLPPLRERKGDIEPLVRHFLRQAVAEGLPSRTISKETITLLEAQPWRGNVRELRNLVFRAVLFSRDERIEAEPVRQLLSDAQTEVAGDADFDSALAAWLNVTHPAHGALYHEALAAFEKPLFEHALRATGGNQLRAAQLLGINRNTLRKRLDDLAIDPDRFNHRG
jgi:two-component system nitrogen regulation response regulator GlnG